MSSGSRSELLLCILCDVAMPAADLANHVRRRHVGNADWSNCGDCYHHVTSYNDMVTHRVEKNHHSKGTSAWELLETITEKSCQGRTSEAIMDSNVEVRMKKELKFRNDGPKIHHFFPSNCNNRYRPGALSKSSKQ